MKISSIPGLVPEKKNLEYKGYVSNQECIDIGFNSAIRLIENNGKNLHLSRIETAAEVYVFRRGGQAKHFDLEWTENNDCDMWNECLCIVDAINTHIQSLLTAEPK